MTPEPRPPARPASDPVIVFIAGWGRSGSTLLAALLGAGPGAVNVGELVYVWERGVLEDNLCGCGRPFSRCPFWTGVGARLGGWDPALATRMATALATRRTLRHRRDGDDLAAPLARLYGAVAGQAAADVVVDSSKEARYGRALRRLPGFSVRVVHLVRDSRAVAFSMSRTVPRPDGGVPYMPTLGPAAASVRWTLANAALLGGGPRTRVRYEDLAEHPEATLRGIERAAGLRLGSWRLIRDGAVTLPRDHAISGNPARFRRGPVPIRLDDQWQHEMGRWARRLCTLITWPLLLVFGYPRRPGRPT